MNNNWKIFALKTLALEKRFVPSIKRIITAYRTNFIADLKTYGKDVALSNLNNSLISEPIARLLTEVYKTAGVMGARLTTAELKLSIQKKAGFGRNQQWINEVMRYLQFHMLDFVQDITTTMREDIIKILQRGIDNSLSIDQIVTNLRATGLITARARVIARTEIVRAANVGHETGARSFPYEVNKKWVAANDHRTRHSHQKINQAVIDENDLFKVAMYKGDKLTGYEEMTAPGDPKASAANTINCRCRITHVPKRDSNGRLIMRDKNTARIIPLRNPSLQNENIRAAIAASIKMYVK